MIAIVDYGMGNIRSVQKGFEKTGFKAEIVREPEAVRKASALVLPGVGAFKDCMKNLAALRLIDPIVEHIQKGKPYLGICLGMQILFTESDEFGKTPGLGLIPGKVVRFHFERTDSDPSDLRKIPHMGWNTIHKVKNPPILKEVPDRTYLYFVHSYYVAPDDPEIIAATTCYGMDFTSMIWKDNLFATQFHPEKSQEAGLSILKQFAMLV
ncbi:MAG: imidazole glycerol phosphate synthase subunit HisH [Nitrospirae bacterium CG_4_9_14_3_um_filter_53_35]|nr:MAG: imidazole glycerol phosphate synthase subunit HisH [Nitrospirae bacterium CG2_30_53_67]PIS36715.1 MAG: imidazole glycerol phosphate synthase subunit HisH [Nitrospirae bacterium CG08_land_8_20_14_0_20_52_24]PIV82913.1 MAG: imidazole glycerol phosphate synthase subunit HisH [Nitrospirae bacterium CG17_big_fil_post_rev_8_21_14_2_50_50_9]PIW84586.1 MAG: imidazole glycerol phosphate synthase subunit HisH [Nitrospirae bacterium CG_4_8_14_3_um_filter_50_41]PJA77343.1 MAG: imidazole glycerol ph